MLLCVEQKFVQRPSLTELKHPIIYDENEHELERKKNALECCDAINLHANWCAIV